MCLAFIRDFVGQASYHAQVWKVVKGQPCNRCANSEKRATIGELFVDLVLKGRFDMLYNHQWQSLSKGYIIQQKIGRHGC